MSRWSRRPAARPAEILDAAFAVFRARGYAAATMDEIARGAGVSAGTIYRYFDGKEAMFRALVERLAARVVGKLRDQLGRRDLLAADWRGRLSALGHVMYENISLPETMGLLQLILGEGQRLPGIPRVFYREVVLRVEALFAAFLAEGMERGELRRLDPVVAHRAFAGMFFICALERRVLGGERRPHLRPETLVDQLITIYLDGMSVEGTP